MIEPMEHRRSTSAHAGRRPARRGRPAWPAGPRAALVAAALLASAAAMACAPAAAASHDRPGPRADASAGEALRHLVLMVDGVPYPVMDSLQRQGHFPWLPRASRLVSPFPSLSGVSWNALWDAAPPAGYEDRYFSAAENRLRGGLLEHLLKPGGEEGFHRHVDVAAGGLTATLGYVFPKHLAEAERTALREEVRRRAATDTTLVIWLVATDALAHRDGWDAVARAMVGLEPVLAEILREHPGLELTLLSDHGNDFVPSRRARLEDAVAAAGLRVADRVAGPDDVVLPRFGLVGSSFLYATPAAEPRLADALTQAEGVDFAAFEDALGRVHVWSSRGRAVVERRADGAIRYAATEGDPLGLAGAVAALRARGAADADGFAAPDAWLAATTGTDYVDGPRRLLDGLQRDVRHPASVVVSLLPGWHYGSPAADWLATVSGTHGSLKTSSALGFFASTGLLAASDWLRSGDVARLLAGAPRATLR